MSLLHSLTLSLPLYFFFSKDVPPTATLAHTRPQHDLQFFFFFFFLSKPHIPAFSLFTVNESHQAICLHPTRQVLFLTFLSTTQFLTVEEVVILGSYIYIRTQQQQSLAYSLPPSSIALNIARIINTHLFILIKFSSSSAFNFKISFLSSLSLVFK